jgi:predicted glycoside hydrolase/deacetylase ChbG (UPF0249 family)
MAAAPIRRLIVNADDFGRAPGVNRGIVAAHQYGIVTSTTLMTNLPWAAAAVQGASSTPELALGLHLSFCYGPPLGADVSSLLGSDGRLNRDLEQLRERATSAHIEREARAQLARFVELTGRQPTHLDAHLHAHSWPRFQAIVVALAREQQLPVRPATSALAVALRAAGVRAPDHFIDEFFVPGSMTLAGVLDALRQLPPGVSELMCHPGYDDDALSDSSFRAQREAEIAILCSAEVRQALAEHDVMLVSYADLST